MVYFFLNSIQKHYLVFFPLGDVLLRAIGGAVTSYTLLWLFGGRFIVKWQHFLTTGTRPMTPERHKKKGNVPTMGGIGIIMAILVATFLWGNVGNSLIMMSMVTLLYFGAIGASDDWAKIRRKSGISAGKKAFLQLIGASIIVLFLLYMTGWDTRVYIPFLKGLNVNFGCFFYVMWVLFIVIGTSNAVNLTDGLDGLAIGSLVPNIMGVSLMAYFLGNSVCDRASLVAISELAVFGAIVIGALLGFLLYNKNPAKIFMGDVGSLSLGAILALLALALKQECLLPLSGIIFVLETLSVIFQVTSFKLRGKRIFLMAPLHHHFELIGYSESIIVNAFTAVSCIASVLAFGIFYFFNCL